ncbi:hypothetical protein RO1_20030 [Roseburia intestinalis XB6B4]|uniref:Uncharacterized protein n=1 Tax=Roseburia intestinalis XB6B4 TaxID=718255 RepID=D4KYV3_9FIRM|nr:hypothetical protein RO1_20030 [Roseburia intestinalis XB6B4]
MLINCYYFLGVKCELVKPQNDLYWNNKPELFTAKP